LTALLRLRSLIAYSGRPRSKRWVRVFHTKQTEQPAAMRVCARLANFFDFIADTFVA
jgi:hypothetical protein